MSPMLMDRIAARLINGEQADSRDLAGDLGDPDRTAQLVGRFPPHDHPAKIGKRPVDHEPRLLDGVNGRLGHRKALGRDLVGGRIPADSK